MTGAVCQAGKPGLQKVSLMRKLLFCVLLLVCAFASWVGAGQPPAQKKWQLPFGLSPSSRNQPLSLQLYRQCQQGTPRLQAAHLSNL